MQHHVLIEDWDGDGAIRLPKDIMQTIGVGVGSTLYLLEEYVGSTRCLVLSKTPRIPDRVDELVDHWESLDTASADLNAKDD
ncbi:AbrB/MazE/SpoVT family DNA-binding domain-containing protein [Pseudomonas aeruginosa]|jgi:antitoxin component of MazEF toxin-antitoxin module|uniref:hypothetical protein n=1 Tax=Pseudomonas aeruginosa group TaxID=136841 RepID=UPI0005BCAC42|nr:hypothetical protein [Pseudomonas aeruginosa]MDY1338843.1 AbrB/MazE/SpoVT family DNA-binding domain-containing protein [Pseudomonas aeruginosa]MEA8481075.1 AbrB/MazE/SpoVT family DNA-binding domain-containing protein [Pseudomonas aeruginosa]